LFPLRSCSPLAPALFFKIPLAGPQVNLDFFAFLLFVPFSDRFPSLSHACPSLSAVSRLPSRSSFNLQHGTPLIRFELGGSPFLPFFELPHHHPPPSFLLFFREMVFVFFLRGECHLPRNDPFFLPATSRDLFETEDFLTLPPLPPAHAARLLVIDLRPFRHEVCTTGPVSRIGVKHLFSSPYPSDQAYSPPPFLFRPF